MDAQQEVATSPSTARTIFFNERGLRAGWRFLIFLCVLALLYIIFGLVVRLLSHGQPRQPRSNVIEPWPAVLLVIANFLVVLLATWVMSRFERRDMGVYGLPLGGPLLKNFIVGWIFWGLLPLTLLLLAMRALGVFYFGGIALHGADIVRYALLWGVLFLFVGFSEEYLTRGYTLYTLADGIGFWPAAVILALLFGYMHMGNSGETRIGIVDVILFAIFASTTLRLTGNLWLAVGAHAGWDWGQSFFYGVNDSGGVARGHLLNPSIQGPDWLSGGSVGPEGSVLSSSLLVVMTLVFVAIYRKRSEPALITATAENQLPPSVS